MMMSFNMQKQLKQMVISAVDIWTLANRMAGKNMQSFQSF